jgi:type IV pilus assembly protein PilO
VILGVGLILLVLVGYYVLLLGPVRDAEIARLEEIQSRAPEIERQLLELARRVPEQPEIPTLVVQVQEIAEESGVTQLLVQPEAPEQPEDGGEYTIIPVTMSFEGNYDQLQEFLLRLRNLTRLVTVETIVYETVEEEGGETTEATEQSPGQDPTLQIELGTEVYAQPGEGGIETNSDPETEGESVESDSEETD